jgi:ABC-type tungstate transport system substrate-binding protein
MVMLRGVVGNFLYMLLCFCKVSHLLFTFVSISLTISILSLQLQCVFVRAMAKAVNRRLINAEAQVRARVSPYLICGWHSATGRGFSPSFSVFPYQ